MKALQQEISIITKDRGYFLITDEVEKQLSIAHHQ